ncbi:MAG: hypothetical protein M3T49_04450 [Candidatus Eremiobacteraeota bacterium]|nr:hypothetical protein [Candidatus Eremiobacteraeota bacterium]
MLVVMTVPATESPPWIVSDESLTDLIATGSAAAAYGTPTGRLVPANGFVDLTALGEELGDAGLGEEPSDAALGMEERARGVALGEAAG